MTRVVDPRDLGWDPDPYTVEPDEPHYFTREEATHPLTIAWVALAMLILVALIVAAFVARTSR